MTRFRTIGGDEVEAVQYIEGQPLPAGVTMAMVEDRDSGEAVERAVVDTKDPAGPATIGDGCWIVTHADGTVSLAHPLVVRDWEEVS